MENIFINKIYNLNHLDIEDDILLNKDITIISPSNMYEFFFESKKLKILQGHVIDLIKKNTGENFEIYSKNMWGYIQTEKDQQNIKLNSSILGEGIKLESKWSFIYFTRTEKTIINLMSNTIKESVYPKAGELLIFPTNYFYEDFSEENDRIALIGSITNDIKYKNKTNNLI